MNPELIKYELKIRGYNQIRVAELANVTPQTVNLVIKGTCESKNVKTVIAGILNKSIIEVFG